MRYCKLEARGVWNPVQFLARLGAAGTHTSGHWHPSLTKPRNGGRLCTVVVVVNCDGACVLHATTSTARQTETLPLAQQRKEQHSSRKSGIPSKLGGATRGVGLRRMQRHLTRWLLRCHPQCPLPSMPNARTKFRRAKRASRQQDDHHRREGSGER